MHVCVFVCLAGLLGHLAAPLSHGGLQEVADQGPQVWQRGRGLRITAGTQEVCVCGCVHMCAHVCAHT